MTLDTASPSLVERLLEIAVDELHYERLDENTERAKQQERDALRPLFIEALAAATAPEDAALVKEALFRIDHHHYVAKVAREYACGDDAEESDRDADLLGRLADRLSRPTPPGKEGQP